jgi:hypothetical protein
VHDSLDGPVSFGFEKIIDRLRLVIKDHSPGVSEAPYQIGSFNFRNLGGKCVPTSNAGVQYKSPKIETLEFGPPQLRCFSLS